jgi:carboxyl-terminal processing protease
MQGRLTHLKMFVLILAALAIGAMGGVALDRGATNVAAQQPTRTATQGLDTHLISQAWDVIARSYVDRPAAQPKELTYAAIRGMTDALGDTGHSRFMTPKQVQDLTDASLGQYEGIGVTIETKNGHTVIVAPMDGSPAQKAGLNPGDIIWAVNGENVDGLTISQVVQKVLGPAGTPVTLTIRDPKTGASREVTIVRARITVHNVSWGLVPETKIAHIRVASFSQGVTLDLQKALAEAQAQGATGVILDLRNDPGGLLDESIAVASQFLKTGNVLQEQNADGQVRQVAVRPGGVAFSVPLVVLINGGTASASEIVSGALQDAHRAQLVGETTFGAGTVLNQFNLSDGSALLLATEQWLTPTGRVIWHKGIAPDVTVTLPVTTTLVIPPSEQQMTPAQLAASGDGQLLKAIELLGQPAPKAP